MLCRVRPPGTPAFGSGDHLARRGPPPGAAGQCPLQPDVAGRERVGISLAAHRDVVGRPLTDATYLAKPTQRVPLLLPTGRRILIREEGGHRLQRGGPRARQAEPAHIGSGDSVGSASLEPV